jgi:hypothetical protein
MQFTTCLLRAGGDQPLTVECAVTPHRGEPGSLGVGGGVEVEIFHARLPGGADVAAALSAAELDRIEDEAIEVWRRAIPEDRALQEIVPNFPPDARRACRADLRPAERDDLLLADEDDVRDTNP